MGIDLEEAPAAARNRRGFLNAARGLFGAAFPALAARRSQARGRLALAGLRERAIMELEREINRHGFGVKGGYDGATKGRGYSQWVPGGGSADADILPDLPTLRERSRDLIRNDPHASGLEDTWSENIVGTGLTPQPRIDFEEIGITEDKAKEFQKQARKIYNRWARSASVTGLSAGEVQELILREAFHNGDSFTIPRFLEVRRSRPYSLAIETIEADRVSSPASESQNESIRDGIRIGDKFGEPLGYYIKKTHPGDDRAALRNEDYAFVPLFDKQGRRLIYHLFRARRSGQSRGVPFLAPAMSMFKDLKDYFRAELIGAKVAACYALFIVTEDPMGDVKRSMNAIRDGKREEFVEPGMIRRLNLNEKIMSFNPDRPGGQFDNFVMRILRAIGCVISTPYELVAMDFSETTYTSGRMALTEVRRTYRKYQAWLAAKHCQPYYEMLLEEAFLMGELDAPGFLEFREQYCNCIWVGPGWPWVDPQKEVDATVTSLANNLSTLAEEAAARGQDWEELLMQRAREKERIDELGLTPPAPAGPGAAPAADPDPGDGLPGDDDEEPDPDAIVDGIKERIR